MSNLENQERKGKMSSDITHLLFLITLTLCADFNLPSFLDSFSIEKKSPYFDILNNALYLPEEPFPLFPAACFPLAIITKEMQRTSCFVTKVCLWLSF